MTEETGMIRSASGSSPNFLTRWLLSVEPDQWFLVDVCVATGSWLPAAHVDACVSCSPSVYFCLSGQDG